MRTLFLKMILALAWVLTTTPVSPTEITTSHPISHPLFRNFVLTDWVANEEDPNVWARGAFVSGQRFVLRVEITQAGILIEAATECLRLNETDVFMWEPGKDVGVRSDCSNKTSSVMIPSDLQEVVGELPYGVRHAQKRMDKDPRRLLFRHTNART